VLGVPAAGPVGGSDPAVFCPCVLIAPVGIPANGADWSALLLVPARSAGGPSLRVLPGTGAGVQTWRFCAMAGTVNNVAARISARMTGPLWPINAGPPAWVAP